MTREVRFDGSFGNSRSKAAVYTRDPGGGELGVASGQLWKCPGLFYHALLCVTEGRASQKVVAGRQAALPSALATARDM